MTLGPDSQAGTGEVTGSPVQSRPPTPARITHALAWPVVLDALVVTIVALLCTLPGLGATALWDPDEPRFAVATRHMIAEGDYLTPTFNGAPRWEKPILLYWAQVTAFRLTGDTEWAARAPAALASAACVLFVYLLGQSLFTRRAALIASGMSISAFRFAMYARQGLTDVPVLACVLAAMVGFVRGAAGGSPWWLWTAWTAVGLGVLTKGPIGLLPCVIVVAWLVVSRDWQALRRLRWLRGGLLALAIAAPWYAVEALAHGWRFVSFHLGQEVLARAVSPAFAGPSRGPWFYLEILPGEIAPWTLVIGAAVAWGAITWRTQSGEHRRALTLLAVWTLTVLALFSAARYKLPHYTLPAYPALFLAAGAFVDAVADGPRAWHLLVRTTLVATAVAMTVALGALIWLVLALFPFDAAGTLIIGLLMAASLQAAWIARRTPAPAAMALLIGVAAALYPVIAIRWGDEVRGHFQAAQALGEAVAAVTPAEAPLASTELHPSLVYYARRPVTFAASVEDAVWFLDRPSPGYAILPCRDVPQANRMAGRPLEVVRRQPVFAPRLKHLIDGRMMTPANELCLVTSPARERSATK